MGLSIILGLTFTSAFAGIIPVQSTKGYFSRCARCLNNFPTSYLSNPSEVIIKIQEAILNVLFFPLDGTKVKQKIIRRERRRVWRTSVWFQHRSCARRRQWRWQDKLFPSKSCKLKYCFTSNFGLFVVSTHYWREKEINNVQLMYNKALKVKTKQFQ